MSTNEKSQQASILIVDDTPENIDVLGNILQSDYKVMAATSGEKALKIAQGKSQPDLILLDVKMSGINGFETCQRLKSNEQTRHISVIFITADGDVESEERGLNLGAVDYITKPFNPMLVKVRIQNQLDLKKHRDNLETLVNERTAELQREHKKSLKSEHLYRSLMESSPDAIILVNEQGLIELTNNTVSRMFGYTPEELHGQAIELLVPERVANQHIGKRNQYLKRPKVRESLNSNGLIAKRKDGSEFSVDICLSPMVTENESMVIADIRDMTEREHLFQQLHQAQKMDALGKLTGGIAHDFNNMLGIILGYAELLERKLIEQPKQASYALEILHAGQRGAKLTRKLLSFSRRNVSEAEMLNINTLLQDQQHMLEKTLTARITLVLDLEEDLWQTWLDSGELEDVILNLSINAMHAIESHGQLTVQTRNQTINELDARMLQLEAGDYVLLNIIDTGCGMDEITKGQIFEPFYSTKGDKGTGLGLSQVYGFVERSGGTIKVFSEPGHGTRFALYFPRNQKMVVETQSPTSYSSRNLEGSETLLVVDDEPIMLELAQEILDEKGYHVLTANDGEQALLTLEKETVDLIISDVIMPNMDGYQLASQVQQRYPQIKIQMVSGFTDDLHNNMTDSTLHKNMLYKPYTSNALLTQIRNLLDKGSTKDILVGRSVLVMDDEENVRMLFKLNLEKLGCETTLACDGDETISFYQRSIENGDPFDVIIMDLFIPNSLGGKEVAEKIRSLDPQAKLIVSSGHSEGPEMTKYHDYGFDGAIEKNFDRKEMKRVLEKVISPDKVKNISN